MQRTFGPEQHFYGWNDDLFSIENGKILLANWAMPVPAKQNESLECSSTPKNAFGAIKIPRVPANFRNSQRFLGFANSIRRFLSSFCEKAGVYSGKYLSNFLEKHS